MKKRKKFSIPYTIIKETKSYVYRSKWHHRVAPLAAQKCVGIDGEDAGKFDEIVANISKLTQAEILAIGSIDCSFRAAAGPSSESELGS